MHRTRKAASDFTLVTGASSGIGRELARQAAADGCNLILIARRRQPLTVLAEALRSEFGVTVEVIDQDLAKPDAASNLYQTIQNRGLPVDVLINNAGVGAYGPFTEQTLSSILEIATVNMVTLTQLTRLFLPGLQARENPGHILNVASVAGFLPGPLMAQYFATKHYVVAFSEGLCDELRGSKVSVTCLCPPPVSTPFVNVAQIAAKNYMATSRVGPEDVARFGYRAMRRGKAVAVYGFRYKVLTSILVRVTPRFALRRLLHGMNAQGYSVHQATP